MDDIIPYKDYLLLLRGFLDDISHDADLLKNKILFLDRTEFKILPKIRMGLHNIKPIVEFDHDTRLLKQDLIITRCRFYFNIEDIPFNTERVYFTNIEYAKVKLKMNSSTIMLKDFLK